MPPCRHGDAHVGFRAGDDEELARWASKQRSQARGGDLAADKRSQLEAAGFVFDGEAAEWQRWYNEIAAFKARHGHCEPHPLAHPNGAPPPPLPLHAASVVACACAAAAALLASATLASLALRPASAADFLLINWCSVQRIMRRCGVLPADRLERLDGLGFDWTGADPLS